MLSRILDSLSRRARLWVSDWHANKIGTERLRHSISERLLRWAGEQPTVFIALVWLAAVAITVASGWIAPRFLGATLLPSAWTADVFLTYFSTLWSIQATVVALVYPIVIAFVAVLLQRRATAKLSLRIYTLYVGVVPAGTSAIALLIWMGAQFSLISYVQPGSLAGAMLGNSVWFALNIWMTGWFLYRTVQFLDDDVRLEIFKDFAVRVAFQREVQGYLAGLIFSNAQTQKLLPGKAYSSDEPGPRVLLFPMSIGEPCITINLPTERVIADIHLSLLRWGISLWLRQVRGINSSESIAGLRPQYPLLQIPIAILDTVIGDLVLCRVQHGPPPGWLASFLIRKSIVFRPPSSPHLSCSTSEILEELSIEVLELIERKRFEAASEAVKGMVDVHSALIRSGAFLNDSGERDNAALLPSPYGFGSEKIHENWLRSYRAISEAAVRGLALDPTMWRRQCYAANRLNHALQDEHGEILAYALNISTHLMYRLGIWWAEKIEERGLITHNEAVGAVLSPPLGGVYDRALQEFVGAWEQLVPLDRAENQNNPHDAWKILGRHAKFSATHAEHTVRMLLGAVFRGDRTSAVWLADAFLKWWSSQEHYFERNYLYERGWDLLTFTCFDKPWSEVSEMLGTVPEGRQDQESAQDVAATLLRRYWTDLRLVAICILLDWAPPTESGQSFAVEIAVSLLQGKNLKLGREVDADALTNPPFVLFHLIRMQLADSKYEAMLDKVVDRAQDLRKPEMVSGRIYSRLGSDDVRSLATAQTKVLTAIIATEIKRLPELNAMIRVWSGDVQQLERLTSWAQSLVGCIESDQFRNEVVVTTIVRREIGLADNLDQAKEWVIALLQDIERLANEARVRVLDESVVSQHRLDDLARFASSYVLGSDNNVFPFTLEPVVRAESFIGTSRSMAINGIEKGAYAEPPLIEESVSTHQTFSEYVAEAIGRWIVIDRIDALELQPLRADSEAAFFDDMDAKASDLRNQGFTPVLLIPSRRSPDWVHVWNHNDNTRNSQSRVSVRPRKVDEPASVVGEFNGVTTHKLALDGENCYVVASEDFEALVYEPRREGACVSVSYTLQDKQKMQVKFEWSFAPTRGVSSSAAEGSRSSQ